MNEYIEVQYQNKKGDIVKFSIVDFPGYTNVKYRVVRQIRNPTQTPETIDGRELPNNKFFKMEEAIEFIRNHASTRNMMIREGFEYGDLEVTLNATEIPTAEITKTLNKK